MNKSELTNAVTEALQAGPNGAEMTKKTVERVLAAHNIVISQALARGDEVAIVGFGSFAPIARPERQGRNPRTGEAVTFAASRGVKFKAGKALKEAVAAVA